MRSLDQVESEIKEVQDKQVKWSLSVDKSPSELDLINMRKLTKAVNKLKDERDLIISTSSARES